MIRDETKIDDVARKWTKYSVFEAHSAIDGRAPAKVLWDEICGAWPELSFSEVDVIRSVDMANHLSLRWAARLDEGFLAFEAIDLALRDSWEVFAVPTSNGSRVGWSRRGPCNPNEPPAIWDRAANLLNLEGAVSLRREPNFVSLLASLCADVPSSSVAFQDLDLRRELQLEMSYWHETAMRQSEQLRKSKASARQGRGSVSNDVTPPTQSEAPVDDGWSNEFKDFKWSDLERWADMHVDQILIVPRALSEAKKALYVEPGRALAALTMLATTYRAAKKSEIDRQHLKEHAERLGLFIGGSVDPSRAGEAGDEYFIRYGGRRRFLDQHVGRGTSRDPRFILRIYFTWCEETQRVVVGWLPTHLHSSGS